MFPRRVGMRQTNSVFVCHNTKVEHIFWGNISLGFPALLHIRHSSTFKCHHGQANVPFMQRDDTVGKEPCFQDVWG